MIAGGMRPGKTRPPIASTVSAKKRAVQVFKLVTEGILEEKISAIIEKKKNLMNGVVKEDDPGLLKTFSRQQLIELLAVPESQPG
jgi:SNF2 family DNA or RNA helicase